MVLVDIGGFQTFYPSCLIGILAEEIVPQFNTKCGAKNTHNTKNKENILNNRDKYGAGFSAEDHEVEEILNLSFNGLSNIFTPNKKNKLNNHSSNI